MAADQKILREYLVALGYKVQEKESRTFDDALKRNTKAAAWLGRTLAAAGTAVVTMTHLFAKQMERLWYSARYADSTVAKMQQLEYGARQIGLESGQASLALKSFAASIRSNPGLVGLLNSLGIKVEGRDKADVMLDLVKALKQMPPYVAERYAALFGMDPETLFNLQAGLEEIKKAQEVRRQMAADMGYDADKAAAMAKEYGQLWRELTERASLFSQIVATAVLPAVREVAKASNELLVDWTRIVNELQRAGKNDGFWKRFREGLLGEASGDRVKLTEEQKKRIGAPQEDAKPAVKGSLADYWNRFWKSKRSRNRVATDPDAVDAVTSDLGSPGSLPPPVAPAAPRAIPSAPPGGPAKPTGRYASAGSETRDPQGMLARLEAHYGLPRGLLDKVWWLESRRGLKEKSPAGAEGHFQFMPDTAKQYGLSDPYNLEESADAAARMWRDLLKKYNGDLRSAAAGYNWGSGRVDRYGLGAAPKETRDYMDAIAPSVEQSTTINIHGVSDPRAAGAAVAEQQRAVNADLVRNFAPKVR